MTTKIAYDAADDLELLRSTAVAAGIIAAGYFRREIKTWTKENASPVSEADTTVNHYLEQALCSARPDYGWLSEESPDDPARLECERVIIVDPIDGTRAFLRGDDCWSVALAIVENGEPIAGVVYAPARDELYCAHKDGGAFLNQKPIERTSTPANSPIIPAATAVHKELQAAGLEYVHGPSLPSLAYRLVQVATGTLDAALARRGAQDWDIAAAAIILSESGIILEDVCVGAPKYNKQDTRHSALAAISDQSLRPLLHDVLRRVYGCPKDAIEPNSLEQQTQ